MPSPTQPATATVGRTGWTRLAASTAAMLALGLSGCGAVDDIARSARPLAEDVGALARSKWVPPHLPPVRVAEPSTDEIVVAAGTIARPANDVEDQKQVVELACQAVDYAEAQSGTDEEALRYLATRVPSTYANRQTAEDLVKNLESARSSSERAQVLGQAALCAWASS